MCVHSGWISASAAQPIATYNATDTLRKRAPASSLNTTPATARVQITASMAQPAVPRSTPSSTGV